ncbi:MAG: GNAT family N-acetyltransferase [Gemmatimonadota bacterium]|nr:GNAT family N-acetyltransferase [Gemmatimonadota bacterium]
MDFRVVEETADMLPEYGSVPIAYEVNSRFRVERVSDGLGGIRLIEEAVQSPYIKDYDELDGPERWARRSWDLSNWIFLGAYGKQERIGGAIVAFHGDDMNYCEGREDLAGLWDIRVHPEYRGQGVGSALFQHAEISARNCGCTQLKVETQNVNVAACRFYARMGARLGRVHLYAYRAEGLDEVELTWYKDL